MCVNIYFSISHNDHRIGTVVFGTKWSRRYWYALWNKVGVSRQPHYVFNFWINIENTKIYCKIEVICKSTFYYFSFWWSRVLKHKRNESLIIAHWDKLINQRTCTDFFEDSLILMSCKFFIFLSSQVKLSLWAVHFV